MTAIPRGLPGAAWRAGPARWALRAGAGPRERTVARQTGAVGAGRRGGRRASGDERGESQATGSCPRPERREVGTPLPSRALSSASPPGRTPFLLPPRRCPAHREALTDLPAQQLAPGLAQETAGWGRAGLVTEDGGPDLLLCCCRPRVPCLCPHPQDHSGQMLEGAHRSGAWPGSPSRRRPPGLRPAGREAPDREDAPPLCPRPPGGTKAQWAVWAGALQVHAGVRQPLPLLPPAAGPGLWARARLASSKASAQGVHPCWPAAGLGSWAVSGPGGGSEVVTCSEGGTRLWASEAVCPHGSGVHPESGAQRPSCARPGLWPGAQGAWEHWRVTCEVLAVLP